MKYFRSLVFAVFLLISLSALAEPKKLTVLFFNDFHGKFESSTKEGELAGGAARIATLIEEVRMENDTKGIDTLLLYGGDSVTGSLISKEFEGAAEFEFLRLLQVDAMVIGNHEFDFGIDRLLEHIAGTSFPVLGGNVFWKETGKPFAQGSTVLTTGSGIKIGIVGLVTEETPKTSHPKNTVRLSFQKPIDALGTFWKSIDAVSDIQIALTHQGVKADAQLARRFNDVELVIGGDDHVTPEETCRTVKKALVCQTPAFGKYLGRIDLEVEGKHTKVLGQRLLPIDHMIVPNPSAEKLVKKYQRELDKKYARKIGRAKKTFDHRRGEETALGNFFTDILRSKTGTDIAFLNSGGMRRPLEHGTITLGDVQEVWPFENHLVVLSMTGSEILHMLTYSVDKGDKPFLQVSGLSFSIEKKQPTRVFIGGAPLQSKKVYTATTIDFLVEGGDGYGFLSKSQNVTYREDMLRDTITNFIETQKEVTPPALGRIEVMLLPSSAP